MKALCFGEVLWDVFGEERKLGGAPMNVAGHMVKLGSTAEVVSAVGNDELGKATLDAIKALDIGTRLINIRPKTETGKAIVTLKDGIPTYRFPDPSAWDEIMLSDEIKTSLMEEEYDIFYFGSLAQRATASRETLKWLIDNVKARKIFFDVNLRLDFYSMEVLEHGMKHCSILKVNDEELPVIADMMGIDAEDKARGLMEKYNLEMLLLTCGKDGSYLYTKDKVIHQTTSNVKVLDTVGAGDSLSAGFLTFLLKGESAETALEKASYLADYVVQNTGAIPDYTDELLARLEI